MDSACCATLSICDCQGCARRQAVHSLLTVLPPHCTSDMHNPEDKENYSDQFGILSRVASDPLFPAVPPGLHGAIGERNRPNPACRPASTAPEPLDKWFSSLRLDLEDSTWTPIARPSSASPPSPRLSVSSSSFSSHLTTDDDPAFKNDLAHVLVWFSEDLTNQQRLVTAYTLAKALPKWQNDFLLKLLSNEGEAYADGRASPLVSPVPSSPDSARRWVADPEPTRLASRISPWSSEIDSERISPASSADAAAANAQLFYADLAAWLRLHRLHKYLPILQPVADRQKIINFTNTDLADLGVTALGARRKFLRLFELMKAE